MAIVYCAVVKRKKARKEIIWLNVFTGKFLKERETKQFLSEEGSLFLTV